MAAQVKTVRVTATGLVSALGTRTNLCGWNLVPGGAAATVEVRDNLDGSGNPIDALAAILGQSNQGSWAHYAGGGLHFENGVYITLTGAGAAVYLHYI